MARSRKYGWNGEMPAKDLSGQAKIVFDGLRSKVDESGTPELHTGREWDDIIGKELRTRQDPYRVVLYYILILKAKGLIRTAEHDITATTKNGEVKHAVTVRTDSAVSEIERIAEDAETAGNGEADAETGETEDERDEAEIDELINAG